MTMWPSTTSTPSRRDRLRAAGLSEERIQQHFLADVIRLDGQHVTDLDQPAVYQRLRLDLRADDLHAAAHLPPRCWSGPSR